MHYWLSGVTSASYEFYQDCPRLHNQPIESNIQLPSMWKVSSRTQGWMLLSFGIFAFSAFVFAAGLSKALPASDNPVIAAIQNDRYYCFLVPLTFPVLYVAVYFHWLSMKLFKHA